MNRIAFPAFRHIAFVTSLTLAQPRGLPPLPAAPAAAPSTMD